MSIWTKRNRDQTVANNKLFRSKNEIYCVRHELPGSYSREGPELFIRCLCQERGSFKVSSDTIIGGEPP